MKVAVTVNENYSYPLKVMLHSLFVHQREQVTVYLVHSRIGEACLKELKRFCASYGQELKEVQVTNDFFDKAPTMQHFTKEMYYRLIFPWLLPWEERVLYLDPDIIVNEDLNSFFNRDLNGAALAAARERLAMTGEHRKRLGLKADTVYMNSGVLLMDLKRMREMKKIEEIQCLLAKKEKDVIYPDQDMLNILWEGEILQAEDIYNLNPNLLYLKEYLRMLPGGKMNKYGKIIHYMGPDKPWNKGYKGGMYSLWAKAEMAVNPAAGQCIVVRLLSEPCRFMYGLYLFWKNHDWKK